MYDDQNREIDRVIEEQETEIEGERGLEGRCMKKNAKKLNLLKWNMLPF